MELDEKMISEIASQLGLGGRKDIQRRSLEYLASKNDAELERELLKVKQQLKANNISYEKQMAMLRSLAPMMDQKQRAKLQRVVEILQK